MSARVLPDAAPPGFWRVTRWSKTKSETFPVLAEQLRVAGFRTVLVRCGGLVALYRDGVEAVTDDTRRARVRQVQPRPRKPVLRHERQAVWGQIIVRAEQRGK